MPQKDIITSIWNYACPTKPISFSITKKQFVWLSNQLLFFFFFHKNYSQKEFLFFKYF